MNYRTLLKFAAYATACIALAFLTGTTTVLWWLVWATLAVVLAALPAAAMLEGLLDALEDIDFGDLVD
jgi:hypothetical protein